MTDAGMARRVVLYLFLYILVIVAPIALWLARVPVLCDTCGWGRPQGLFACLSSLLVGLIAWVEIRKARPRDFISALPVLLFLVVGLFYSHFLLESALRPADYETYEHAALTINEGGNPYKYDPANTYDYPPSNAQVLAWGLRLGQWGGRLGHAHVTTAQILDVTYYLFVAGQFLLVLVLYVLAYLFVRRLGVGPFFASLVTAALLVVNVPLARNLASGQVNLWMVDGLLACVLLADRHPWLSGIPAAIGAHVKVYPVILVPLWLLTRRFKAALGFLVAFGVIVLLLTSGGTDWHLWRQYGEWLSLKSGEAASLNTPLRCNNISAFLYNLARMGQGWLFGSEAAMMTTVHILYVAAGVGILVWLGFRFLRRERLGAEGSPVPAGLPGADVLKLYGNLSDTLAFVMLMTPLSWEHFYLLAIPVALFAAGVAGRRHPWLVFIACLLIFGVATIEVFPFCYTRIAGLLMLLWVTSPAKSAEWSLPPEPRLS